MRYTFLATISFFEIVKVQSLLSKNGVIVKLEDPYHFNITAGWVDPFCNNNERNLFVLEKDLQLAKKILSDSL